MEKRLHISTIAVFGLLIFGLAIANVLYPIMDFSETENRVLAQKPPFTLTTVLSGEFEVDYEAYLSDQFVWRNGWIGLKTDVERLLLKSESKDIFFAKDDYLIEKHTGAFASDTSTQNIAALAQFVRQCGAQLGEAHITVIIVPNAVDILQDKLPAYAASSGEDDYLLRLASELPEDVWFDAAAILRAHNQEALFYRTDHHWETLAAFYVYQAWAKEQGFSVPELADYEIKTVTNSFEGTIQSKLGIQTVGDTIELFLPRDEIAYTVQKDSSTQFEYSLYDMAALNTKDKYAVFFGGNQGLLRITTDVENSRKILVVKDSYANCFIPFVLGEFQVIDVFDLRYTRHRMSDQWAKGGYTDLLFLYNAAGFAEDTGIGRLLN